MNINFNKNDGLVPVIIQNSITLKVLMLGYMNQEAFEQTIEEKKVTFWSRSKKRLWTKGESSGNFLWVKEILVDCDQDTILIMAVPDGPTCHTGNTSCFDTERSQGYLYQLEQTIHKRIDEDRGNSYSNRLFKKGINKIAQKVGEEAIELIIEAKDNDDDLFKNEAADLLYHFLILLKAKKITLDDIEYVLYLRSIKPVGPKPL